MGLSQAALDRVAQHGVRMLGGFELVTFYTKSTPGHNPTTRTGINVHLEQYSLHELAAMGGEILKTDLKCRIQTSLVIWTPSQYDEFTRASGTRWIILTTTEGNQGTYRPWTILPCRQVA